MRQMRLKIVSDGFPEGTHVFDADTGQELTNIVAVSWKIAVNEPATAVVEVVSVEIDALSRPINRADGKAGERP